MPSLRACSIRRLAAAGGLLVLGPGLMVLLALALTRAKVAGGRDILLEGRPQGGMLYETPAAQGGSVSARLSTTDRESTITVQRAERRLRHKSSVTCDPQSYEIVKSRDILVWDLNIVRVDTERTREGLLIDIRAGTQSRRTMLPLERQAGIWHAETLPFLVPCLKEEAGPRRIAVFEPRAGRVCATNILPVACGRWRCTNDVRSLSVAGVDYRLQSFRETLSGMTREFAAGEDHSEKTTP